MKASEASGAKAETGAGDETRRCRECALRLLARREHSLAELRRKLEWRHFSASRIDETLHGLRAANLQSDARFAELSARNASERGRGPVYIRHQLEARGVSGEDATTALEGYREQWPALAVRARARKFGAAPPGDPAARRKQLRFLLQRGFTAEQAHGALGAAPETEGRLS